MVIAAEAKLAFQPKTTVADLIQRPSRPISFAYISFVYVLLVYTSLSCTSLVRVRRGDESGIMEKGGFERWEKSAEVRGCRKVTAKERSKAKAKAKRIATIRGETSYVIEATPRIVSAAGSLHLPLIRLQEGGSAKLTLYNSSGSITYTRPAKVWASRCRALIVNEGLSNPHVVQASCARQKNAWECGWRVIFIYTAELMILAGSRHQTLSVVV